jgi:hypothetical protein
MTEVLPMFASPYAAVTLPSAEALNQALLQLIAARRDGAPRNTSWPARTGAFESREDFLHLPDAPVRTLRSQLLDAVARTVADLSGDGFSFDGLNLQARGWWSVIEPGGAIPARAHAMSSWTAIYCVQAGDSVPERIDSGALRFHDPRLGNAYLDGGNERLRRPYGFGHFTARCVAGRAAIFPSFLQHEIAPLLGLTPLVLVTVTCRLVRAGAPG